MTKIYLVTLTDEERKILRGILNKGNHNAQKRKRAQALLLADDKITDAEIAARVGMHRRGIEGLRQRFVEEGFEITLEGKPKGHRQRIIQGADEARLIALVCGKKPDGYDHWSLRLLNDTFVTLDNTKVSHEAICQTLKKTNLNPGKTGMVSDFSPLPPEQNAEFVAAMEDVLDVYTRPEDEKRPLVCYG